MYISLTEIQFIVPLIRFFCAKLFSLLKVVMLVTSDGVTDGHRGLYSYKQLLVQHM